MGKIYKQNCKGCNEYYEGRGSMFCSVGCSSIDKERAKKQGAKLIGRYKNGKEINCLQCDVPFYASKYYQKRRLFCSRKCVELNQSEVRKGSTPWNKGTVGLMVANSGSFKNFGKTKLNGLIRAANYYKYWRKKVYERDDYTCQSCGTRGGVLHTDHVVPLAEIINQNNITTLEAAKNCVEIWDTLNGRTLCVECHRKTDTWGSGTTYYGSATGNYAVYS